MAGLSPLFGGAPPAARGSLDIDGASPNCWKEISGAKKGRRAPPPVSDPMAHMRHFPQRRHSDRMYAECTSFHKSPERRHDQPFPRPVTPPHGMPPVLKRLGGIAVTAKVDVTRKYPDKEAEYAMRPEPVSFKRALSCKMSETATGMGQNIGNVRRIMDERTGENVRARRSKEQSFEEETGSKKKFDMQLMTCHASRETPVSFPGWTGYPPTYDKLGTKIDYSLKRNGGPFATRALNNTSI